MITLYPTGYPPVELEEGDEWAYDLQLGKRRVRVVLYETPAILTPSVFTLAMSYISDWEEEQDNVIVLRSDNILDLCALARAEADLLLPPGAGYPATAEYEARQSKLQGQIAHAALTALTECLAQRHRSAPP